MNKELDVTVISMQVIKYLSDLGIADINLNNISSTIESDKLNVVININYLINKEVVNKKLLSCLLKNYPELSINIDIKSKVAKYVSSKEDLRVPGVKNIIAISSGKGGVGKSSLTINLALSLHKMGAKVGILDADIYGPSIPKVLGTDNIKVQLNSDDKLEPIMAKGLATLSITNLVGSNAAVWRGPMASKALQQMLNQTNWPNLDYLFIDLPPGTGDIQLTMAQKIPVTAAVIVATKHELAIADALKAKQMFEKVSIPMLGAIFNMDSFTCNNCGTGHNIFESVNSESLDLEELGVMPFVYDFPKLLIDDDRTTKQDLTYIDKILQISTRISYELSKLPRSTHIPLTVVNN